MCIIYTCKLLRGFCFLNKKVVSIQGITYVNFDLPTSHSVCVDVYTNLYVKYEQWNNKNKFANLKMCTYY